MWEFRAIESRQKIKQFSNMFQFGKKVWCNLFDTGNGMAYYQRERDVQRNLAKMQSTNEIDHAAMQIRARRNS